MSENLSILDELKETVEEEYGGDERLNNPPYESEVQTRPEEKEQEPEEEETSEEQVEASEDPGYEEEEEKPKKEEKPKGPGPIPYERFKEVVDQRREFKEAQERLQRETSELRGQLTELVRAKDRKPPPDPNEDPDAYIAHANAEMERLNAEVSKLRGTQSETQEQQEYANKVHSYTQETIQDFVTEHPDYFLAANHLQAAIVQERMELGDSAQGAQQYYNNLVGQELARLYETKGNPALYAYNMAKKYGYKPPNGEAQEAETEETSSPKPKRKPVDKEKAQKASRSVATKGKAAETDLSEVDIDQMSHKQFMEFVKQQQKAESDQPDLY